MKKNFLWLCIVAALLSVSCGGNKEESLQKQLDSLQNLYDKQTADYNGLNGYLSVIADGLDSIAAQEGQIFNANNTPGESPALNRQRIKENLTAYQQTLADQRQRIAELEKKLTSEKGGLGKLHTIVAMLKQQLEAKDAEVAQLKAELNNKNVSLTQLQARAVALQKTNTMHEQMIAEQNEVMKAQDEMVNEGYILIASKAELKKNKVLTGGSLLKKKTVDYNNLDKSLFKRVDIRKVDELTINSKKPKILTPVPQDSYQLVTEGDKTQLKVTNPGRFWSISTYLVIQTD